MDKEGPRRRRDDAMSDTEFLAGYEAKHGRAAMLVVARAMAMDPPPFYPSAEARRQKVVGVKPKPRKGLSQHTVRAGRSWTEGRARAREEGPPAEKILVRTAKRSGECGAEGCGGRFEAGDEVVRLLPSGRLVHGGCAKEASMERVRAWERWREEKRDG